MLEENALAAAAFSDDCSNLVLVNCEIRPFENGCPVEALGDVSEFYQRCFHGRLHEKGRNDIVRDQDHVTHENTTADVVERLTLFAP